MKNICCKFITIQFIVLIVVVQRIEAQVTQEWVERYNGPGNFNDVAYAMTSDAQGNIYVAGTINTGTGSDLAVIKYNSVGAQVWVQTFNGGTHDVAFAIKVDDSGNVYVAGSSQGGNGMDYATIKYNASGVQQWFQIYEGPAFEEDIASSVAVDVSGNVYVTGYSVGIGSSYDYATIKYSSSGVEQWIQRYNGTMNVEDVAASIAVDGTGNIYVTGRSDFNYVTIKYDPSGLQEWLQVYNGTGNGNDETRSLVIDGSNNIYVTGSSFGTGTDNDFATIKYNSSGIQQWVQRYNSPSNSYDYAYSMAVDGSSNVYVTGNSADDYATIKYNSSGVQQWAQIYNGTGNAGDAASSLAVDASGNVYVTGYSYTGAGTTYDYATIKYNSSGTPEWVQIYNGPGNFYDMPHAIALDGSENIYVTGQSGGSGSGLDFATIKYSQQPIPVELTSFTANITNEGNVVLNWSTATETNNQMFEIERRAESDEYYEIGYVEGAGTTTEPKEYFYIDQTVEPGEYYYRLKQIDFNGVYEYSDEVFVEVKAALTFSLEQNYPNPFNPSTKIEYSINQSGLVTLTIFDMLGNEIWALVNEEKSAGVYEVDFNAEELTSGIYFCQLQAGSFVEVKKMILMK